MKIFLQLIGLVLLTSCATGAPPTWVERAAFYVTTNWEHRISPQFVLSNNFIIATNWITNAVPVPHFEPRPEVQAVLQAGGAIATASGFPIAAPIVGLLWLIYGTWAEYRNKRKDKLTTVLCQNIETYSEVTKAQPNGAALDAKIKTEIASQQVEAGVKKMASDVHDNKVNTSDAKASAAEIVKP